MTDPEKKQSKSDSNGRLGADTWLGCIVFLAIGSFLVLEGALEKSFPMILAGIAAFGIGSLVIYESRKAITRDLLAKGSVVIPIVFSAIFLFAGITGLVMGFRPRLLAEVSAITAWVEISAGIVFIIAAIIIWIAQKATESKGYKKS